MGAGTGPPARSAEPVVPAPSQEGPGRGAAGGPGPISILIAGLGAHLDRGLITGQTLRARAGRARRSPFRSATGPRPKLLPDNPPLPPL